MEANTYRFTVFLMKEYVRKFESCIKPEKKVKYIELKEEIGINGVIIVADSVVKRPEWVNFLEYYSNKEIQLTENVSNKAVMLVEVQGRIMALTFGYGRTFLKEDCIEKNFGLITALNMLNSKQIRSINAATIEDMVVHTQKQSNYATGQEEFSLNVINDIMTSISGKAKNELWANSVSGKDSLLVSVEMFPDELQEKLECYLSAYKSEEYKKSGFGWIDNVREVRDVQLKDVLEKLILEKLQKKEIENIFVSPPEIIDWNSTKGFMISGMGKRHDNVLNYKEDLYLKEYLDTLSPDVDLKQKIKRDRIWGLNVNDDNYVISSLYSALVAQIEYEGELFILSDSCWYRVNNNFYNQVKNFVSKIPISNVEFPECGENEHEGAYNKRISTIQGFCLMDQKLIGVNGGARQIEACDIFTCNKQFIHIKNRSKSSQLSHLFSQGKVSAECFCSDEEYRKQLYKKVKDVLGKDVFNYRKKPKSNEFEVIYGIITNNVGPVEDNLPFFSLVNLMLAIQELDRMHMKYSIKMISKE